MAARPCRAGTAADRLSSDPCRALRAVVRHPSPPTGVRGARASIRGSTSSSVAPISRHGWAYQRQCSETNLKLTLRTRFRAHCAARWECSLPPHERANAKRKRLDGGAEEPRRAFGSKDGKGRKFATSFLPSQCSYPRATARV